ncbi:MAG: hypothetical protein ABSG04_12710 [Verrucomicrobiota bacterium]
MNDPGKFKAPFIPKERIWQETEKLRAAHASAIPPEGYGYLNTRGSAVIKGSCLLIKHGNTTN